MEAIGLILVVGIVLGPPILAIWAASKVRGTTRKLSAIEAELSRLSGRIISLETHAGLTQPPPEAPSRSSPLPSEEDTGQYEEAAPQPVEESPAEPPLPVTNVPPQIPLETGAEASATSDQVPPKSLEERLASRWLVWLGGIALALGGAFLVKVSIDMGLLGPKVRIALGLLLAAILAGFGEFIRRRPLSRAIASIGPNYVPPALSAAGVFTAFGTLYAAYALYNLLPPLIAFILLAAISLGAVGLAFVQGPFLALMGVGGGFLVPLLVSTDRGDAWTLFPYIWIVATLGLGILRYIRWPLLSWVTLAGATAWPALWLNQAWAMSDGPPVGMYLVLATALFLFIRPLPTVVEGEGPARSPAEWQLLAPPASAALGVAAVLAFGLLLFALLRVDSYGLASLTALGAFSGLCLLAAWRADEFDSLPVMSGLLVVSALTAWHLPQVLTTEWQHMFFHGPDRGMQSNPVLPPEFQPYALTLAIFAAIYGAAGYLVLWRSRRPVIWSAVSGIVPLVLLGIAYWRIEAFELNIWWATLSVALAFVYLIAAERLFRRRGSRLDSALGVYAACVVGALAMAATMALDNAWLTVAISLEIAAIAWIESRLPGPHLRRAALFLAGVVLTRLLLNPYALEYPIGDFLPGVNWILYGYGLPAASFFVASRLFRQSRDDLLVHVLEAGSLVFSVLLVTFEIRQFVGGGRLDVWTYELLEQALNTLAWSVIGYGLLRAQRASRRPVVIWGWRILAGITLIQVIGLQLLSANPVFTDASVGSWPILNLLLLAYAVPAIVAVFYYREAERQGLELETKIAGIVSLVLAFAWITLEIRHSFHGSILSGAETSDAEWYAYSVGWLIYAGGLLTVGIRFGQVSLRYASLVLVILSIGKVFLFDMSALTGIYRALSFLGLGAALVGIGYLYQRFVFPPAGGGEEDVREETG